MSIKRQNMPIFDKSKVAEHSLPMLRRDFTRQSHCCLCKDSGHPLPSGKATILVHPEIGEIAAGPTCSDKFGVRPAYQLPDLTRAVLEDPQSISNKADEPTVQAREADARHRTIEYLLLRQKQLPELGFETTWPEFEPAYKGYLVGELNDDLLKTVKRKMDRHDEMQSRLSYDNLQTLYAVAYWLNRCKQKKPRNSFLHKTGVALYRDKQISDPRIEKLNEIIHECFKESAPQVKAFKSTQPYRPQSRYAKNPSSNRTPD